MYLPAETNVPKTIGKSQSIELKTDPISASIPTQKESPNLIANEPVRDEHVINMEFTHPKTLIRMQPVPEILFRAIRSVTDPIKTIKNSIVMKPIQPVLMKPIRMVHDEPKTSMLKKKKYQVDEQSKHLKGKLHQKKSVRSRSEPMLRKTDYLDYLPVGALPIKHTLNPELERLFDQAFKRKL